MEPAASRRALASGASNRGLPRRTGRTVPGLGLPAASVSEPCPFKDSGTPERVVAAGVDSAMTSAVDGVQARVGVENFESLAGLTRYRQAAGPPLPRWRGGRT